jgi:hypothetical protein
MEYLYMHHRNLDLVWLRNLALLCWIFFYFLACLARERRASLLTKRVKIVAWLVTNLTHMSQVESSYKRAEAAHEFLAHGPTLSKTIRLYVPLAIAHWEGAWFQIPHIPTNTSIITRRCFLLFGRTSSMILCR